MKTKEELNALKEEFAAVNRKLRELTDEELRQVSGGKGPQPTREHSACDIKNSPISIQCTVQEAVKKQYAALGECENCTFNPNA